MPHSRIALELGVTVDELCERFADEIEHGAAQINAEMLEAVRKRAMGGSLWAIKLLLKERDKR